MKPALFLLALSWFGCKERGTHVVTVDGLFDCPIQDPAPTVQLVVIAGGACGPCECGDCLDQCADRACEPVCPAEGCPIDRLGDALDLDPGEPGDYAVVIQLLARDDAGIPHIVSSACVDVELDADGTEGDSLRAEARCCAQGGP